MLSELSSPFASFPLMWNCCFCGKKHSLSAPTLNVSLHFSGFSRKMPGDGSSAYLELALESWDHVGTMAAAIETRWLASNTLPTETPQHFHSSWAATFTDPQPLNDSTFPPDPPGGLAPLPTMLHVRVTSASTARAPYTCHSARHTVELLAYSSSIRLKAQQRWGECSARL